MEIGRLEARSKIVRKTASKKAGKCGRPGDSLLSLREDWKHGNESNQPAFFNFFNSCLTASRTIS